MKVKKLNIKKFIIKKANPKLKIYFIKNQIQFSSFLKGIKIPLFYKL